jgi:membrane-associated phospholipid phosphatase
MRSNDSRAFFAVKMVDVKLNLVNCRPDAQDRRRRPASRTAASAGVHHRMVLAAQLPVARWKRILVGVGPDYLAVALFLSAFATLAVLYRGSVHLMEGSVIWPLVVLAAIVMFTVLGHARGLASRQADVRHEVRRQALRTVRDWLPLIMLILVYENLRSLTGLIRPQPIDMQLYALDVALVGLEPTVWIQRFVNPWLTDYFAFAYTLYFIIPLVLATTLYVRAKRSDFKELMIGVLMVMYTGFLLYLIFPAGPPRFAIAELYTPARLHGALGFFEATQGVFDGLNPVKVHSSFPSLHCALSMTALLYAWRFRRQLGGPWMAAVFFPLIASLWIATVYLRHHWIVDCVAGWALAVAVFSLTPLLRRFYSAVSRDLVAPDAAVAPASVEDAAA